MSERIPPLRAKIFSDVGNKTAIVMPGKMGIDNDDRLRELGNGIGLLALLLNKPINTKDPLQRIAAYAIGWATMLGAKNVFDLVHAERERQIKLHRTGKFWFTCASTTVSSKKKFRVIFEEGGEVAKAIDEIEVCEGAPSICKKHLPRLRRNLIAELIQVAAVAVAWLESLEVTP